jgi:RNA polymerase sigma-70 factor (ECF subfamily)
MFGGALSARFLQRGADFHYFVRRWSACMNSKLVIPRGPSLDALVHASHPGAGLADARAEDAQLVRAVVAGHEDAAMCLVGKFWGLIRIVSWAHCRGNVWDMEDLLQELAIHVIVKIEDWDCDRGSLSGFVATIVRRKAIDWTRRTGHYTDEVSLQEVETAPEDGSNPQRLATIGAVRECISRIRNPRYRRVLELHLQGLDYEHIAERMTCPKGTVATWLHRAKAELKPHLERSLAALSLSKVA